MTKSNALEEQRFCSRCNVWGPTDAMQPLYRCKDPGAAPWLWLHHHCAEIYSSTRLEAGMKRFEAQVHSMAESQARGFVARNARARARMNLSVAADRAAKSLQALQRAKAALEIANIDPDSISKMVEGSSRKIALEREQRELRDSMRTFAKRPQGASQHREDA